MHEAKRIDQLQILTMLNDISDTTPIKQGRFSPGAHIPINSPEAFTADLPDYAVLFAWNHLQEIDAKEREFRERGGKWIIPVRGVQIL